MGQIDPQHDLLQINVTKVLNKNCIIIQLSCFSFCIETFTFVDNTTFTLYANDNKFQVLATLVQKLNYCTLSGDK